ncbi:Hypothetical protein NocV09_08900040 [Nannochloropsis oceanica]
MSFTPLVAFHFKNRYANPGHAPQTLPSLRPCLHHFIHCCYMALRQVHHVDVIPHSSAIRGGVIITKHTEGITAPD